MKTHVNLGCGQRFHRDWLNVDFSAASPEVVACDLLEGIPFPRESFEVVYHSHLLEHLPRDRVPGFLSECRDILRPGGILRIAVPDLEQIARLYLVELERAAAGDRLASLRHEWMTIELCDQMTRSASGGELGKRMSAIEPELMDFVTSRMGVETRWWTGEAKPPRAEPAPPGIARRLRALARWPRWREAILARFLPGRDYAALTQGRFRSSGEIHRWMYDRVSLTRLLLAAGFVGITRQTHATSLIPDWSKWELDSDSAGRVAKPDSLFIEARRPTATTECRSP